MSNILDLDFKLETSEERIKFLDIYLKSPQFKTNPLTQTELETITNYIFWGKDENGSPLYKSTCEKPETRNNTWSQNQTISYEGLLESPGFSETQFQAQVQGAIFKYPTQKFNRTDALKRSEAIPDLHNEFKQLFRQIDQTEMILNYWEILNGKRDKPPREELLLKFNEMEQQKLKQEASALTQYQYLKKKHDIVEMRRQQYSLRDCLQETVKMTEPTFTVPAEPIKLDQDLPVFPLGIGQGWQEILFQEEQKLNPKSFTEEQQKRILKFYWQKQEEEKQTKQQENFYFFDFENQEQVYQLLLQEPELRDLIENDDEPLCKFLDTLDFYVEFSQLSDIQRDIIRLKQQKKHNQDIANYVNEKYGKTYGANYISTIFCQKICPAIVEAVAYHRRIIENLCYVEEFKSCNTCKRFLLIDPYNFVRKSRAKDGFTNRCKCCDQKDRQNRKE